MMPVVLELLLLVAVVWGLAAWRVPALVWVASAALYLLSWGVLRDGNALLLTLAWGAFLPAAALLSLPPLRQRFISRHLRAWFARVTPEMSTTEREALEAGHRLVGWRSVQW